VLAVGPHPSDDNDRLCVLAKANMTSKTDVPAIRLRIEGVALPDPGEPGSDIDTARIVLLGEEQGHQPEEGQQQGHAGDARPEAVVDACREQEGDDADGGVHQLALQEHPAIVMARTGGEHHAQTDDDETSPATSRFQLTRGQVAAFVRHARELVAAGRPPCPYCGTPLNDGETWCPCWN